MTTIQEKIDAALRVPLMKMTKEQLVDELLRYRRTNWELQKLASMQAVNIARKTLIDISSFAESRFWVGYPVREIFEKAEMAVIEIDRLIDAG